jgi:hypothetical protein
VIETLNGSVIVETLSFGPEILKKEYTENNYFAVN